jgi:hypothetical protein
LIVRIPAPYRQWERVVSWPYGTVVYDLDVSVDGRQLSASFGEITGQQDVRVFDTAALLKGETTPMARFDFGQSVPSGFVFSPDGRYLFGSSYYTGVSNIFRYDLSAHAVSAVTNTDVGFFRPIPTRNDQLFVFRYSDLDLDGFAAGNLDRLPEYQNVAVDVTRLYTLNARLSFSDVRNSLGNVDDETGRRWSVEANGNYVDGSPVSRFYGAYDRGWALPTGHSSFWFREAAGFSPRGRDEPFANFFFGGFGNNWVDRGNEKRYREYFSFPGMPLNNVAGRNFTKALLEWNLPPIRFQHAGTPGFYATRLRPAIFAGGLITNLDAADARRQVVDLGGQLDVRFSVLSALDLTLSCGAAAAFEDGHTRREAMVSLKILR